MTLFRSLREKRWVYLERQKIRARLRELDGSGAIKLNIGSGPVSYPGWINLDLPYFDLTQASSWKKVLGGFRFDSGLIEHVLEHLTVPQVSEGLSLARKYITPNGNLRIAVPDKNHPDPDYIAFLEPGGTGPGADDHKTFWNISSFTEVARNAGFDVEPIEYYTGDGKLITHPLEDDKGPIIRTARKPRPDELENYSSLILDLKPQ